jgi:hypothetical protein
MTRDELIQELRVDDAKFAEMVEGGLPVEPGGSYDRLRCLGWLADQGRLRRFVTRRELSSYFGTSEANIRHWISSGMPSADPDRFDLDEAIKWRLERVASRQSEAKEALMAAKADREELAADLEAGRLIDPLEVEAWRRQTVSSIRSMLDDFADLAYGVVDRGYSADDARRAAQEKIDAIYADLESGEKDLQEMLAKWYSFLGEHFDDADQWLLMWHAFCKHVVPECSTFDELVAWLEQCGFTADGHGSECLMVPLHAAEKAIHAAFEISDSTIEAWSRCVKMLDVDGETRRGIERQLANTSESCRVVRSQVVGMLERGELDGPDDPDGN